VREYSKAVKQILPYVDVIRYWENTRTLLRKMLYQQYLTINRHVVRSILMYVLCCNPKVLICNTHIWPQCTHKKQADVVTLLDYNASWYCKNDTTFPDIFSIPSSGFIKTIKFLFLSSLRMGLKRYPETSYHSNSTFRGPCIVIYYYNKSQRDALFLKFILIKNSTCFGQIYCPS
jgi:hypothetical protein